MYTITPLAIAAAVTVGLSFIISAVVLVVSWYYLYKNNKGICCSFSLAYYRIMTRLNIPCKMTVNADHTHQWNEVFIDGKWQEVDITEGIRLYNTGFPNAEMRVFLK